MATYTELRVTLTDVGARTDTNRKRVNQALALITQASVDLASMPSAYATIVADINAGLAASPSNPAWQTLKAEKDLIVTDFQALKVYADAVKAAAEGA